MFCISGMEGARLSGHVTQLGNGCWVVYADRLEKEEEVLKNGKTKPAIWTKVTFREPTERDLERASTKTNKEEYLAVIRHTSPIRKVIGEDGSPIEIEDFLGMLCIREKKVDGTPAKSFTIRIDGKDATYDPESGAVTVTPSAGFGIRTGRDVFDRAREKAIKNQKVFEERAARWRAAGGHVQRFA